MKRHVSVRSRYAVAMLLGFTFFSVWIFFSTVLTWCTAITMDRYLEEENGQLASNIVNAAQLHRLANDDTITADTKEYWIWDGVNSNWLNNSFGGGLLRSTNHKPQTAVAVYDGEGSLIEKSENAIFIRYITEDNWYSQRSDMDYDGVAKALYDASEITQTALNVVQRTDWVAMRFTGSLEDGFIIPSRIEYISYDRFRDILSSHYGSGKFERHIRIREMEEKYGLSWDPLLVSSSEAEGQQVFYSLNAQISLCVPGDAVNLLGRKYDDLMDYVLHIGGTSAFNDHSSYKQGTIWDTIITDIQFVYREGNEDLIPAYQLVAAVRYSPMIIALESLLYVYIGSFLLMALDVCLSWRILIHNLVVPVESFNEAVDQNWGPIRSISGKRGLWLDGQMLRDRYHEIRMERSRLITSLQYAQEAETNRRQLTSYIAHELKTPISIIHSYAEGLKEHIAEEKRDNYIEVILSEVERTDNMVMEMLDLSRLEAGRIKLSRDDFSLIALTDAIFEKLEMTIREKNLQVNFSFPKECFVTADEGRIAQVVENFATNAIKYTPSGGSISISIQTRCNGTIFRMENDCTPLSDEALTRVWDTFYRTDESRSGSSTGLGLAIAKNIIELHGGKCFASNTKTGVAFSFSI